jgi:hypothetical protein
VQLKPAGTSVGAGIPQKRNHHVKLTSVHSPIGRSLAGWRPDGLLPNLDVRTESGKVIPVLSKQLRAGVWELPATPGSDEGVYATSEFKDQVVGFSCSIIDAPEGISLVPLLKDPDRAWERPAVVTYLRGNHAVCNDRWRYIHYANGGEGLCDHQDDPNEWPNLADVPKVAAVKEDLATWLPKTDAPDLSGKANGKQDKKQE